MLPVGKKRQTVIELTGSAPSKVWKGSIMKELSAGSNMDPRTVAGFGEEWQHYDQTALSSAEWEELFERYFSIFPWATLPENPQGFDLGCGSGRWAEGLISRVGILNCIDPSFKALEVCRRRLARYGNARFHNASVDAIPLADNSQDFGYSLGVLHHVPDTQAAIIDCVRKLKPGAPFLVYLYYALDNRPVWFRALWGVADVLRRVICRMPFFYRKMLSAALAASVYWPLARGTRLLERLGFEIGGLPLASYRNNSFYTMRTNWLDRFGTRLEQRFTRAQIASMMEAAGLENIHFSPQLPFWVALGTRVQESGLPRQKSCEE